jgi:acetyl-CoA C-acetyltransferase
MSQREIVLCHPVRTAIGAFNGSLKSFTAPDLGATAVRELMRRAALDPVQVGAVVMGNVVQAGNKMNPARQAGINGGLPVSVPAMTVNRVCGSGAQAIASVASEVLAGYIDVGIAGGMENMDQAPYLLPQARWGYRMGHGQILDSLLNDGLNDAFSGEHSGWHTENLVARYEISRREQDRWAERSQARFAAAQEAGHFQKEIVGVEIKGKKGVEVFDRDEANRPGTNMAALERLRPAFREGGTITAGNAPGLNSGAAAVIVADRAYADRVGLQPMARLVAHGVAGVEPDMFGLGPVPAIKLALERAGWKLADIDSIEINEAFAAVPLAVMQQLGVPEEIVNMDGGAIAHGHPIGATGAVLTVRLLHAMQRKGMKRGLVSLCIGGGQGIALALEMI